MHQLLIPDTINTIRAWKTYLFERNGEKNNKIMVPHKASVISPMLSWHSLCCRKVSKVGLSMEVYFCDKKEKKENLLTPIFCINPLLFKKGKKNYCQRNTFLNYFCLYNILVKLYLYFLLFTLLKSQKYNYKKLSKNIHTANHLLEDS